MASAGTDILVYLSGLLPPLDFCSSPPTFTLPSSLIVLSGKKLVPKPQSLKIWSCGESYAPTLLATEDNLIVPLKLYPCSRHFEGIDACHTLQDLLLPENWAKMGEMASPSLADLPTELVLKIVHNPVLTQQDLYSLSITSRRLNLIVIPILLALLGFPNTQNTLKLTWDNRSFPPFRRRPVLQSRSTPVPMRPFLDSSGEEDDDETTTDEDTSVRLEAAVMVSLQLPPIQKIVCTLPQTFTDLTNLILHLSRFQTLLFRVKNVVSVTFNFTGDHRYRHLKSNPRSAVPVPFADIFGDIVRSLVAKGCESLLLYNNSEQLQDDYRTLLTGEDRPLESRRPIVPPTTTKCSDPVDLQQPPTSKKEKKNIFSKAKANLKTTIFSRQNGSSNAPKSTGQDLLYPPFDPGLVKPRSGRLRNIHIQTPFALLPRCFPVFRDIIHSSLDTLTSITLSYILFDEALFDSCLSSLFLNRENKVTHLRIVHCHNISPPSLLSFLKCFDARLEYLELDWHSTFIRDDEKIPGDGGLRFQHLKTLVAPLDWVAYLLKHHHLESNMVKGMVPLPSLSNVTIKCRLEDSFYFQYNAFAPLLDNILKPLYYQRSAGSKSTTRGAKINITLDMILDRSRPFQLDLDTVIMHYSLKTPPPSPPPPPSMMTSSNLTPITNPRPRPPKHWDLISKLELYPTYPPVTETQAFSLAQWVTMVFPAVEQVALPLPFIPRLMPIERYKSRQKELAEDAAEFLKEALRLRLVGYGETLAWKTLVVGPWMLSLEQDTGGAL